MNLRNTVEIELGEALERHVGVLLDSALLQQIDETGLKTLINNLKAVEVTYKKIEEAIDVL
jgi:anti-anti-sigma regulatory factor